MKIHPDQLQKIQEQLQQQRTEKSKQDQGFARILEQQLGSAQQTSGQTASHQLDKSSMQALHTQLKTQEAESPGNQFEAGPMQRFEQILGQWEEYSQQLQQGQSLRQSYQTLQSINQDIQDLKQSPELSGQNPELKSMLGELEVLAVTEEIKLNRGDYL
ncbi:MAG: hypothetical protein ACOC43_09385 [Desulfohalobiaceae bacterium]